MMKRNGEKEQEEEEKVTWKGVNGREKNRKEAAAAAAAERKAGATEKVEICRSAIDTNKRIAWRLLDLKKHVTTALQKCEQKLAVVEKSLEKHTAGNGKMPICSAGMPYFKDRHLFSAFSNRDERQKKERKELELRNLYKVCSWTKKERAMLLKAIEREASRLVNANVNANANANKDVDVDGEGARGEQKVGRRKHERRRISPARFVQTIRSIESEKFDWLQISVAHFEDVHSPLDCSVIWNVFLHPDINRSCWIKSEDTKLMRVAERCRFQDWGEIAKQLGTNRSAYQCFVRYNTKRKLAKAKMHNWQREEDQTLLKLVEAFRVGDYVPWGEVASWMQTRTKQQVYFRWAYSVTPHLTKGRFTKAEDILLKDGVSKFGRNFRKISAVSIPNRSSAQLQHRYRTLTINRLDNWNQWTPEEDAHLLHLFSTLGPNWSAIAKDFSFKTRTQLRHRHAALRRYINRGISLFQLHQARSSDQTQKIRGGGREEEEEGEEESDDSSSPCIDEQLIDRFRLRYKVERFMPKWQSNSADTLTRDTRTLENTLLALNANLRIPNDLGQFHLTDRDYQLSCSLRQYKNSKSRDYSRLIDEYKSRMFPRAFNCNSNSCSTTSEQASRFVPPPPFNSKIKFKKSQASQSIDYLLNNKMHFLLEKPTSFCTPDLVLSFIGGHEQQLQFQKLADIFAIGDGDIACGTDATNADNTDKADKADNTDSSDTSDTNDINSDTRTRTNGKTRNDSSGKMQVGTEEQDTGRMYASHATLCSFKNFTYLKRVRELEWYRDSKPDVWCDRRKPLGRSNGCEQPVNLLEARLQMLFRYPIGLSKSVLPEVGSIDTFSGNDIQLRPKRKTHETSDTLEKPAKKRLQSFNENIGSLR